MKIDKILVLVDFSTHSRRALDEAIGLAKRFDAELHLLHCYQFAPRGLQLYGVEIPESFDADVRRAALRRMGEWHEMASAAGVAVHDHMAEDLPASEAAELARSIHADLVVIGTRGVSGLQRWLLGSVAEQTLRTAPCPVLTVHAPDAKNGSIPAPSSRPQEIAPKQIRKILVPVDFSDHSQRALEEGIALAKEFGAELHLLHCYPIQSLMIAPYGIGVPPTFEQEVRMAAERRLSEWGDKASAHGIRVEVHVTPSVPSEEIPSLAARVGADLIVMGTRGLGGFKHLLLGSVTERTIRVAPCPVLTVRREAS